MIVRVPRNRKPSGKNPYPADRRILPAMRRPGQSVRILLPDNTGLDIFVDEIRQQDGHFWAGIIISSDKHPMERQWDGPQINIDCLGAIMGSAELPGPPAPETVEEQQQSWR